MARSVDPRSVEFALDRGHIEVIRKRVPVIEYVRGGAQVELQVDGCDVGDTNVRVIPGHIEGMKRRELIDPELTRGFGGERDFVDVVLEGEKAPDDDRRAPSEIAFGVPSRLAQGSCQRRAGTRSGTLKPSVLSSSNGK